jgi:hypothetical protein
VTRADNPTAAKVEATSIHLQQIPDTPFLQALPARHCPYERNCDLMVPLRGELDETRGDPTPVPEACDYMLDDLEDTAKTVNTRAL